MYESTIPVGVLQNMLISHTYFLIFAFNWRKYEKKKELKLKNRQYFSQLLKNTKD